MKGKTSYLSNPDITSMRTLYWSGTVSKRDLMAAFGIGAIKLNSMLTGVVPIDAFEPIGKKCSYLDCDKPYNAHGYCTGHYQQDRRGEDLRPLLNRYGEDAECSEPYCHKRPVARGKCNTHHSNESKGYSPITSSWDAAKQEWIDRTVLELRKGPITEHLLFPTNSLGKGGHATLGNRPNVHRLVYKLVNPNLDIANLDLDHDPQCPKTCVNSYHLTPRSRSEHSALENTRRGMRYVPEGLTKRERQDWHRRIRQEAKRKRPIIFKRDHGICYLCSLPVEKRWELDHILPIWAGGTNNDLNLAVAHPECHYAKEQHVKSFLLPCLRLELPTTHKEWLQEQEQKVLSLAGPYLRRELTLADVMRAATTSRRTVVRVFKEHGVQQRTNLEVLVSRRWVPSDPQQLLKEYDEGFGMVSMGKRRGVSAPTIRRWLTEQGITLRSMKETKELQSRSRKALTAVTSVTPEVYIIDDIGRKEL